MALAIEDLKRRKPQYEFVLLQATDMAVPFYEAMGFARVGCLARHAPTTATRGRKEAATTGHDEPVMPPTRGDRCYAFRKRLFGLLKRLSDCDANKVFQEPVDTNLVVDYLDVVAEPMDFGTMRRKLVAGKYPNLPASGQEKGDSTSLQRGCSRSDS